MRSQKLILLTCSILAVLLRNAETRLHHLTLASDSRRYLPISTFGFFSGGFLFVNLTDFSFELPSDFDTQRDPMPTLGFSVDKTTNDALNPYVETSENRCLLDPTKKLPRQPPDDAIIRFNMDFLQDKLTVKCSENIQNIKIFHTKSELKKYLGKDAFGGSALSDSAMFGIKNKASKSGSAGSSSASNSGGKTASKKNSQPKPDPGFLSEDESKHMEKRDAEKNPYESEVEEEEPRGRNANDVCSDLDIPMTSKNVKLEGRKNKKVYNTSFVVYIGSEAEEGMYSLYFHNCYNYKVTRTFTILEYDDEEDLLNKAKLRVGFTVAVEERNSDGYLSAGEEPLPALYILIAILFFLSGCFWVFILKKSGNQVVFRVHWIMAALVFLKSLSLFFHGINYQKIDSYGQQVESWAVLYYITHLLKGGLLFFTIVLIGSGWAFVKHIFTDGEKKVFMFVLPLQIIANVAYIIVEESEEGEKSHSKWKEIFILVDLLCCGAILLPVVWSIRHLQDSTAADGKATTSIEKLKLFRHFYIMVVCYIYFTRIIVYLLKITVPFQYEWIDVMFGETATFVFYVMTGYKFRPATSNPYFKVSTEDEYDMEEVLISSNSIDERVTSRKKRGRNNGSTRMLLDDDMTSDSDEDFFAGGDDGIDKEGAELRDIDDSDMERVHLSPPRNLENERNS